MRFVDPQNDVAFEKIFGNDQHKEIYSFLNAVLELQGEKEIADIEILNPYQAPKLPALKFTLLDVRARDKRGAPLSLRCKSKMLRAIRNAFSIMPAKPTVGRSGRGMITRDSIK